jgi:hypothetical protein
VDQEGKVAAVRCRAALDVGVEAVFMGTAPGYRLEKTAQADTGKTAGAGAEAAEKAAAGAAVGVSAEAPRGAALYLPAGAEWSVFWRR